MGLGDGSQVEWLCETSMGLGVGGLLNVVGRVWIGSKNLQHRSEDIGLIGSRLEMGSGAFVPCEGMLMRRGRQRLQVLGFLLYLHKVSLL